MIEKQIENKLTTAVKKNGGIALKLVCPSFAGMPDRLILLPDGHIGFAELKAPGKKPRPLQLSRDVYKRQNGNSSIHTGRNSWKISCRQPHATFSAMP